MQISMKFLKKLYFSKAGLIISVIQNLIAFAHKPFMVYGYRDRPSGQFRRHTRISSNCIMLSKKTIHIGDHVWIWHHSILDGTSRLIIGEGCQIGANVGIFTHSSHIAIRTMMDRFIHASGNERIGYVNGQVSIDEYTFIGAGAKILPGTTIGKKAIISTGAVVNSDVPDYAIVAGIPAKIVGDTRHMDKEFGSKL